MLSAWVKPHQHERVQVVEIVICARTVQPAFEEMLRLDKMPGYVIKKRQRFPRGIGIGAQVQHFLECARGIVILAQAEVGEGEPGFDGR